MPKGAWLCDAYQDGAKLVEDPSRWRTIAERLSDGDMPPDGEDRPDDAQLESLITWIERQVAAIDRGRARDPGRVTMRRLNRVEYNNTIRDLIGLDFHPSDDFPADDVGYGFDNNGDVLSLPPLLMEKYLSAAQKIADAAIVTRANRQCWSTSMRSTPPITGRAGPSAIRGWQFYGDGNLTVDVTVLVPQEYRIAVKAYGQQAGPDPARMDVSIDGRSIAVVDVAAMRIAPQTYEITTRLASGKHTAFAGLYQRFLRRRRPAEQAGPQSDGRFGANRGPRTCGWHAARIPPADHLPRSGRRRRAGHGPRDFDRVCRPGVSSARTAGRSRSVDETV